MFKKALALTLLLSSYYVHSADTMGFGDICNIYTTALSSNMNIDQLSDYIFSNIEQHVKSKDALDAHEAVMQLDASQRYEIFKQAAQLSLKHSWDCPAMKKVMATKK